MQKGSAQSAWSPHCAPCGRCQARPRLASTAARTPSSHVLLQVISHPGFWRDRMRGAEDEGEHRGRGRTPCAVSMPPFRSRRSRLLRPTRHLRRAKTTITMITMTTTVPMPIYMGNSSHCAVKARLELPRARRRKPPRDAEPRRPRPVRQRWRRQVSAGHPSLVTDAQARRRGPQLPRVSITSLECVTGSRLPSSSIREPLAFSINSSTRTFTRW